MKKAVETREEIRRMMEREWQRFRAAHPDLDLRDDRLIAATGAMLRQRESFEVSPPGPLARA